MRSLDSDLKEKLATWLSPAVLELHRITWDDPASLLEKIVVYEVFLFLQLVEFFIVLILNSLTYVDRMM